MESRKRQLEEYFYIFLGGFLGLLAALFFLNIIYQSVVGRLYYEAAAEMDLIAFFNTNTERQLGAGAIVISLVFLGAVLSSLIIARGNIKRIKERVGILEELDKTRTEFVWMASHQLQTPLSALKWSTEMLLEGEFGRLENKEQRRTLEKASASTERLIILVDELLNIARIESKRLELNLKSMSLREFQEGIKQITASLKKLADQKNLSLVFESLKPQPIYFDVDLAKIQQVTQSLLENAIWYTSPRKKIKVEIVAVKNEVSVRVIDEGIGIPPQDHPKVFSKFFRADNARRVRSGGTGLGLYFCKILVESHGGKIWFISQEGKGSTFGFNLPLKMDKTPEEFLKRL